VDSNRDVFESSQRFRILRTVFIASVQVAAMRANRRQGTKAAILILFSTAISYSGEMGRTARASKGDFVYHVLNRGNGRQTVFHKDGDLAAFVRLMREGMDRLPMRLMGVA